MGHNALGTCCADCAQKASTLGKLGWIPSGFGELPPTETRENQLFRQQVYSQNKTRMEQIAKVAVFGVLGLGVIWFLRKV